MAFDQEMPRSKISFEWTGNRQGTLRGANDMPLAEIRFPDLMAEHLFFEAYGSPPFLPTLSEIGEYTSSAESEEIEGLKEDHADAVEALKSRHDDELDGLQDKLDSAEADVSELRHRAAIAESQFWRARKRFAALAEAYRALKTQKGDSKMDNINTAALIKLRDGLATALAGLDEFLAGTDASAETPKAQADEQPAPQPVKPVEVKLEDVTRSLQALSERKDAKVMQGVVAQIVPAARTVADIPVDKYADVIAAAEAA